MGFGAKELFNYNRENFKFDQDQRIERETLRLEMQVKRFELFREDVRDLVELTVDRMDVYHLVGALFLEFCVVLFCEGRIQGSAPPFLLSMFLLSNACAFIYLLLAVWLSMHASIASHSFGVRLLTRFVRLPIPSVQQMNSLRSQFRDYERQDVSKLLALPFQDQKKQEWDQVDADGSVVQKQGPASNGGGDNGAESASTLSAAVTTSPCVVHSSPSASYSPSPRAPAPPKAYQAPSPPATTLGRSCSQASRKLEDSPSAGGPQSQEGQKPGQLPSTVRGSEEDGHELLPEEAMAPMGGDDLLTGRSGALPERHIQLFRTLQSKWQCYDAYCRVCMGLGVNQLLQALSYYAIAHTLVENRSPTTGWVLVILFQSTTVALAVLDLAGLMQREIMAIQLVGILPCCLTAWGIQNAARNEEGELDPEQTYKISPFCCLFQALWLELWLRVAAPSGDQAKLPRRFRQVLFLDVFSDAHGWDPDQTGKPEDGEDDTLDQLESFMNEQLLGEAEQAEAESAIEIDIAAQRAASQLDLAQSATRRWAAVPPLYLPDVQKQQIQGLKELLKAEGENIKMELERHSLARGLQEPLCVFEEVLRPWESLSASERQSDPFSKCLLGPFENDAKTALYHFDLEGQTTVFENASKERGAAVLELQSVATIMGDLGEEARQLYEMRVTRERRGRSLSISRTSIGSATHARGARQSKADAASASSQSRRGIREFAESAKNYFPNLVSLFARKPSRSPNSALGSKGYKFWQRAPADEAGVELLRADSDRTMSLSSEIEVPSSASAQLPAPLVLEAPEVGGISGSPATSRGETSASPELSCDATLVAMAGQHAEHFAPERLPWMVVSKMTRMLQFCWLWSMFMALLKEADFFVIDIQQHPGSERRLCPAQELSFEDVQVDWPHGTFFRPQGLFCNPSDGSGELLIRSPFAIYSTLALSSLHSAAARSGETSWFSSPPRTQATLVEIDRSRLPLSTVSLCIPEAGYTGSGSDEGARLAWSSCLLAAPSGEPAGRLGGSGIVVWPFGTDRFGSDAATLPLDGQPWKLLAGAVVRCSDVATLLEKSPRLSDSLDVLPIWCLLLAGWDGEMLPVAAVPLPDGSSLRPPVAGMRIMPCLDAPLSLSPLSEEVVALHLDPRRGRLWALLSGGELESWDLLGPSPRNLGRRKPRWPRSLTGSSGARGAGASAAFMLVAICEEPTSRSLYAIGRAGAQSAVEGAVLLRARLPDADFDASGEFNDTTVDQAPQLLRGAPIPAESEDELTAGA